MIILDTNVISEPLRASADKNVTDWINAQDIGTLYLSTIAIAEVRYGIAIMQDGKRKELLHSNLEQRVLPLFENRILAFDLAASQSYAILRSNARSAGQAIAQADGYIAAIALAHGFSIATRDTKPFTAAGLTVINPWDGI